MQLSKSQTNIMPNFDRRSPVERPKPIFGTSIRLDGFLTHSDAFLGQDDLRASIFELHLSNGLLCVSEISFVIHPTYRS